MLIEFRASNYRSIGDEQILSMVPSMNQKEYPENILTQGKYNSLIALSIYGANGSGKSNLVNAFVAMVYMVTFSHQLPSTSVLPYDPFLLREGFPGMGTTFEVTFLINEIRYRYGFTYDKNTIRKEWLMRKSVGREVNLFSREGNTIDVTAGLKGNSKNISAAIDATKENGLFLSALDTLNIEEAKEIIRWFGNIKAISGLHPELYKMQTVSMLQNPLEADVIKDYLGSLCLNISDVGLRKRENGVGNMNFLNFSNYVVTASHQFYDAEKKPTENKVVWDWETHESSGSTKAMNLSGAMVSSLKTGGIIVIDEIEAFMHPIMTLKTIELFLDKETNQKNAQIIFATHDTNLLTSARLRRDQIYFAEKNDWESTEIYSLSDFKYITDRDGEVLSERERPDADKEGRYIEGRYGAIPLLGNMNENIKRILWPKEER